jgi:hypothetical protein
MLWIIAICATSRILKKKQKQKNPGKLRAQKRLGSY